MRNKPIPSAPPATPAIASPTLETLQSSATCRPSRDVTGPRRTCRAIRGRDFPSRGAPSLGTGRSSAVSMMTSPRSPSSVTRSPSLARRRSSPSPTTSGNPRLRATIATCETTEPETRAMPRKVSSRSPSSTTSAGQVVGQNDRVLRRHLDQRRSRKKTDGTKPQLSYVCTVGGKARIRKAFELERVLLRRLE